MVTNQPFLMVEEDSSKKNKSKIKQPVVIKQLQETKSLKMLQPSNLKILLVAGVFAISLGAVQGEAQAEPMLSSWYGPGLEGNLTASGEVFAIVGERGTGSSDGAEAGTGTKRQETR